MFATTLKPPPLLRLSTRWPILKGMPVFFRQWFGDQARTIRRESGCSSVLEGHDVLEGSTRVVLLKTVSRR